MPTTQTSLCFTPEWETLVLKVFEHTDGNVVNEVDQAMFYCIEGEKLMELAVHVDDCSAMASSVALEEEIKMELCKVFKISDLCEITWILGMAVKCDCSAQTIALSQKSYINSILSCYGFENIKPIAMPWTPVHTFQPHKA